MSKAEFARRRAAHDPFLERLVTGPVTPVVGDLDAIA
jgi:hypothetical protein